ncbi:MAG TPA: ATP-binding cassette domain-containing protein [Thermoanaerobaculia bacterium]|jgi:molybdate transport system ATP-binding protein
MIELRDVALTLPQFRLEVTLAMNARTTAIYGPSGAGKTSILEVIAGLRVPERGAVLLNGRDVTTLPSRERRVGYVPQDDALFPHLSVRSNITYGGALQTGVVDVLELGALLDRGVSKLSGGEKKRVALARALLSEPEVLLLDEPLAGVDVELRARVLEYLVRVRDNFRVPMLLVTHQREEVDALAEEVVLLERGRVSGWQERLPPAAGRR